MPLPVTKSKNPKDNAPLVIGGGGTTVVVAVVGAMAGAPWWAIVVVIVAVLAFTLLSQLHTERYDP